MSNYTHTTISRPFFRDYPGEPVPEEIFFWTLWCKGRYQKEADTSTIRLGTTPSGLISDPPPSSPFFMPDALPASTLPIYPGLGQAPNMLACIPSGLSAINKQIYTYHHYYSSINTVHVLRLVSSVMARKWCK